MVIIDGGLVELREKKRDQVGWKNTQHALPVIFPAVRWRSDFVWGEEENV